MELKTHFFIKEENSFCYVCNSIYKDSPVIETHRGNLYPALSRDVAELICDDLNLLSVEQTSFDKYNLSLVYCVLSTLIEAKGNIDFAEELSFTIQWDRVFRLDPGPPHNLLELKSIEKIISFLESKWVDLPLNYSISLEEMKERNTPEVPENIINEFSQLTNQFNQVEIFAVDLLFNLFKRVSISSSILWVAGLLNNEDIQKIDLYIYHLKSSSRITELEKTHLNGMSERLDFLRKLIDLSKTQNIITFTKNQNEY